MNNRIFKYIALSAMALLSSCADFTDIEPKGQNIMSTTQELEMLLNDDYDAWVTDMRAVCGDCVYGNENIVDALNRAEKTRFGILISWDQEAHDSQLAGLMANDELYSRCYNRINRVANPIISRVDYVSGNQTDRDRIKCEALLIRALFHYFAVQKFARAYDKSYAATTPAIPYVLDTDDILEPQPKRTLQEVYDLILADINQVISIDGLPERAVNRMRMNKACAYAAKAMVLMAMQDCEGAAAAARQALAINDVVTDYNTMTTMTNSMMFQLPIEVLDRPLLDCDEDYFSVQSFELANGIPNEAWDFLENGNVIHDKFSTEALLMDGFDSSWSKWGLGKMTATMDLTSSWNTVGLKTTYMYLILAENDINNGNYDSAMANLDRIRAKRISPAKYAALEGTVTDKADAIYHLKQTAHGEGLFTIYNFINRKRWNRLDDYKETFTRKIGDRTCTISPESTLWIFPFPQNVTGYNPYVTNNF